MHLETGGDRFIDAVFTPEHADKLSTGSDRNGFDIKIFIILETRLVLGNNAVMATEQSEPTPVSEADLQASDAADAPPLAEALADQLEAELEGIANQAGGGD